MNIEIIKKMIHDVVTSGQTPRTLILTMDDADKLGLPTWTRQFLGLKVVIAANMIESKVVPHFYDSVQFKKRDEKEIIDAYSDATAAHASRIIARSRG